MAPNASSFCNSNFDNHAVLIRRNICHQFNYNNNYTSLLLKNRLKSARENFVAVNSYYLKENYVESVNNLPSSTGREYNENTWLCQVRSVSSMRFELIRKTMVKQAIKERMEMWQKKKDELSRNRKFEFSSKSKFESENVLVKKEKYKFILDQIKKRTDTEQTITFNYQQRSREIYFKVVMEKAVFIENVLNNDFNNQDLVLSIGKQIEVYHSMKSRLDILKNIKVVEEAPLKAARSLLEDLTLYKNNVVMPIQAQIKTTKINFDNNKNLLKTFSVNIPDGNNVKQVRKQYNILVKNNKLLNINLTNIKKLPFVNDPTTKLFRQNVVKVIYTLINTISSTSAAHLTEKYNKLNALLSGKLVCVANTQVMIGNNKEALVFCMDTLVTKIISYAEEVISVKTQAAYELAAVITKLWGVHQQFGKILIAEIRQKCPLLVPFCYPAARSLIHNLLDYKSLGYKFDSSGNCEPHDRYLNRMIGIVRLFAALIATSTKYDQSVIGISQAWIFLAGTLNQNPVASITATMLVELLNIVGFAMYQGYGKQFIKLLQYINTQYLEKIKLVTPAGYGGPTTRLRSFLEKSLCVGLIEEPKGMLSSDFM